MNEMQADILNKNLKEINESLANIQMMLGNIVIAINSK